MVDNKRYNEYDIDHSRFDLIGGRTLGFGEAKQAIKSGAKGWIG